MHEVHHGNGLHLYPQASYWDWPFTADKTNPRLLQIERDWIWYKAWSSYAWKCKQGFNERSLNYWSELMAKKFGTDLQHASHILAAYEESGRNCSQVVEALWYH